MMISMWLGLIIQVDILVGWFNCIIVGIMNDAMLGTWDGFKVGILRANVDWIEVWCKIIDYQNNFDNLLHISVT